MQGERRSVRIVVRGRVQGVGYRATAAAQARALGLGGWVRNRGDGSVELQAEGSAGDVEALIALCREGPRHARVESVEICDAPSEDAARFEVRP